MSKRTDTTSPAALEWGKAKAARSPDDRGEPVAQPEADLLAARAERDAAICRAGQNALRYEQAEKERDALVTQIHTMMEQDIQASETAAADRLAALSDRIKALPVVDGYMGMECYECTAVLAALSPENPQEPE